MSSRRAAPRGHERSLGDHERRRRADEPICVSAVEEPWHGCVVLGLAARRYVIGVAIVLAFVLVPQLFNRDPIGWSDIVFFSAIVIAVPVALAAGFRIGERRRLGSFATIAVAYGLAAATGALLGVVWTAPFSADTALRRAWNGAYLGSVMIGIWGMFMLMPQAVREARERAQLQRDAERARIRSALEPHFVLNTLNAISGLVVDDPERARELVGDLGDLLRDVVRLSEEDVQPAEAELAWLQRYARIIEARHPGQVAFEWSIDPDAARLGVPVLLLQPLLENAIFHGALQRPGGGHVRIALSRRAGALRCTIEDDGPGVAPAPAPAAPRDRPHGLDLTRRRLACDPPGGTLVVESSPTGTRTVVELAAP